MDGSRVGLPPGYYLVRDPDILALRRQDDSMVGVFSVRGAEAEEIRRTARTDDDPGEAGPRVDVRLLGGFEVRCRPY